MVLCGPNYPKLSDGGSVRCSAWLATFIATIQTSGRGGSNQSAPYRRAWRLTARDQCGGDGVNVWEARLERLGLDRHIPVLGHAAIFEDFRGAVCWHAKEEVVGKLAAVVDGGDPALGVDRPDFAVGDEGDVPLRERGQQRPRGFG